VISSSTIQGGPGEDIRVEVGRLTLTEGAAITSATIGTQASPIIIRASVAVFISRSRLVTTNLGPGAPGRIVVQTPTLSLTNGAQITARTSNDGSGGDIVLEIGRLTLTGGARIDTSAGGDPFGGGVNPNARGSGGTVTVTATEAVFIAGGDENGVPGGLFSATISRGAAGRISVTAPTVTLADRAQISAGTTGE